MKIAVCSAGEALDSPLDPRFGRCVSFVVVDADSLAFEAVENTAAANAQGAGIQAAQLLSSRGVSAVIAGNFGPNAFQALAAAGIKTYSGAQGTVSDAVEQFKKGQLQEISGATVSAHSGMQGGVGRGGGGGRGGGMGRGGGGGQGRGGR